MACMKLGSRSGTFRREGNYWYCKTGLKSDITVKIGSAFFYLRKAHSWLTDPKRETLCRLIDCEKLSPEACTHAVQNNRLPLRTVVQVLFFEQLRLRRFVMDHLPLSDENPGHGYQKAGLGLGLNGDLVSIQARVVQLEEECGVIHRDRERLECSRSGRGLRLGAGFGVCGKRYDAVSSSTDY